MEKITKYLNLTEVRLKNRRVVVENLGEDGVGIRLDIKDNKDEPRSIHLYKRGRTSTLIKLTKEAATALAYAIYSELEKDK